MKAKRQMKIQQSAALLGRAFLLIASLFLLLSQLSLYTCVALAKSSAAGNAFSDLDSLIVEGQTNYTHGRYKEAAEIFEQAQAFRNATPYQRSELQLGLAESYRSIGQYKKAEELFKTGIEEAEKEDAEHLNKKAKQNQKHSSDLVPLMMNDLAILYMEQSRFNECQEILNRCIELGIRKVGPKNVNLALPKNALTRLYLRWGRFSDAKAENDKTLELFSTPALKNNWLYAYTAFNLAEIFKSKGDYKNAERLYKATLLGVEDKFGFEHQYCAVVLEPLGDMYRQEGRFTEARKCFDRMRKIRETTFSKEHPEYGKVLLALGLVSRDEGRYVAAEEFCHQATSVIENALGENNIEIANCWITDASIFRYQGRYDEAEKLARHALALDQKLLGNEHPAVAHDMVELGNILSDQNKNDEASKLMSQALEICQKKLGPDHPDVASVTDGLARIALAEKDLDRAEKMYKRSLELAEKSLGKDSAQALVVLREQSSLYLAQKRFTEAQTVLARMIELDQQLYGKKSPELARDLVSLANLFVGENKRDLAAPLLAQAAEITKSLPGASSVEKYTSMTLHENASRDRMATNKWAFVVGVSNFKDSSINLKYAAKDAIDFRNFLISQENFPADHVQLLTDLSATKENIISKLGEGWLGKRAGKDDLVVVYISSHGSAAQEEVGVNFLVTYDTDKEKLVSTGLPMQWLTKIIQEQVHSNRVVLILDVCHSGSATEEVSKEGSTDRSATTAGTSDETASGSKGITRGQGVDLSRLSLGSGQIVLCSSLANQVSWESLHYANSVFTHRLIEALQCNGKETTLRQAYERLKETVGAEVLGDRGAIQTPSLSNKNWTGGDPVLATTTRAVVK
jgi:tetratricopeptide (TPR) repeat protein